LKTWQEKQEIGRTRHRQMTHIPPNSDEFKIRSEYEVNFGKRSAAVHSDLDRYLTKTRVTGYQSLFSFDRETGYFAN
jgi:hypothetical protein